MPRLSARRPALPRSGRARRRGIPRRSLGTRSRHHAIRRIRCNVEIRADRVKYVYNAATPLELEALRDVSFVLPAGKVLGLIGGTGSGKTTLIRNLNGLLIPTSGSILVGGVDTRNYGPELRRKVGVVFQRPERQLFDDTVFHDISFVLTRFSHLSELEIQSAVDRACKLVGLDIGEVGDRSPQALSDGERRKAAIAGILVHEPDVLVLDEPAVGLDPPSISDLVSMIGSMKEVGGTTVVIASHDMDPFLEVIDLMMVLQKGRAVAFGTPDEVCSELAHDETFRPLLPELALLVHDLRAAGYPIKPNEFRVPDLVQQLKDLARSPGGNS